MADKEDRLPFPPPHPGEILREDILPALNMTVKDLARHLGVKRQTLSPLINGRRSVSVEMAQRLGKAFGNGARFWLALQMQYEIWHAEHDHPVDVAPLDWKPKAA
jgi:addiction module HigA family antidote